MREMYIFDNYIQSVHVNMSNKNIYMLWPDNAGHFTEKL